MVAYNNFARIEQELAAISAIVGSPVSIYRYRDNVFLPVNEAKDLNMYSNGQGHYRITDNKMAISDFQILQFPGCCAFAISTAVMIYGSNQNKGINKHGNIIRQEIAKISGYTALLCTDVRSNIPERKTLERNGFKDVYSAVNRRTGNDVIVSVKTLDYGE